MVWRILGGRSLATFALVRRSMKGSTRMRRRFMMAGSGELLESGCW